MIKLLTESLCTISRNAVIFLRCSFPGKTSTGKTSTGLNVGLVVGGVFGAAAVLILAIVAALTAILIYTKMSKKYR